jgi:hypothetical protein
MARVEPAKGFSVARYFFHIKDGADLIKDQEGTELPTAHAARLQALLSARELWADAIRSGKPLGADAVVIADEHGGTLTFVPMNEALPKRPATGNFYVGPDGKHMRRRVFVPSMQGDDERSGEDSPARSRSGSDRV